MRAFRCAIPACGHHSRGTRSLRILGPALLNLLIAAGCLVAIQPATADAAICGDLTKLAWSGPSSVGDVKQGFPLDAGDVFKWGEGTSEIVSGDHGPEITARFPEGSINPGNTAAPEGGVGFLKRFPSLWGDGCLVYEVMFEDEFAFGEGGKLPGLFGGVALSGCTAAREGGFSARYMWGRNGVGFLYPYFSDRVERCGAMVGLGMFRFTAGRWHQIAQRIRLNAAGQKNGIVEIWFDKSLVLQSKNIIVRGSNDVYIEGIMFETFFGGSDPSRASPLDQSVKFRALEFFVEP